MRNVRHALGVLLMGLPIVALNAPVAAAAEGWSVSGGVAFDLGDYGQDGNGATFIAAAIATPRRQGLVVRAQVQHGSYSGDEGPIRFTPIGVGPRYYAFGRSLQGYVELLPSITIAKWASYGNAQSLASIQASVGLSAIFSPRAGLDLDLGYLRTEGSVVEASDSPDIQLKGLEQMLARVLLCIYFDSGRD